MKVCFSKRFKRNQKRFSGFSLIEISVVLLIVGIMMGAVIKGRSLIEQSRISSAAYEFARLQTSFLMLTSDYGQNVLDHPKEIWQKLYEAKLLNQPEAPESKLGGRFALRQIDGKIYLSLENERREGGAFLKGLQVKALLVKIADIDPGHILVLDERGNKIKKEDILPQGLYVFAWLLQA